MLIPAALVAHLHVAELPLEHPERAALERKGASIGLLDLLIAAQAVARGLVLVTDNLREFRRVPGLRCENWTRGK